MPTSRSYTFLITAFLLYLFANQTQVGWLYVMSALLAGVVMTAFWLSRKSLQGIDGQRKIGGGVTGEIYEGDIVDIDLTFKLSGHGSAAQIRLTEVCPLAAPDSPQRAMNIFIPLLPAKSAVQLDYEVLVDRRGLHEFPPLDLTSRAPFGFFQRHRTLSVPTRALVYPEVRSLRRLDFLDRQLIPQMPRSRAGFGHEILGVRPYRTGDSPRHIHWRSVARTGDLISKEFADETQPGLTLALDLFQHPYADLSSKHNPFEWAVKIAASIGDYAQRKGYPLYLAAADDELPAPPGPVSWSALLQYLARVQPTSNQTLTSALTQPTQAFVIAVVPRPDTSLVESLVDLQRKGVEVLAVILDPQTFPTTDLSALPLLDALQMVGVETRLVKFADDWAGQLSEQPEFAR